MTTLYGIKSCDTVRKARRWLDQQAVSYHYHDLRNDGIDAETINHWLTFVPWNNLLNTRSTSYRNLPAEDKQDLDEQRAIALMLAQPTLIKRPVLVMTDQVQVGFKAAEYEELFAND